jgi:Na+-driven multidrug efflux pump
MQSLSGAGDTVPPMIFGLVTSWLVTLPLAYLLPKYTGLEILGVRWALVAGMVVQAVFAVVYFRLGRWKRKRV